MATSSASLLTAEDWKRKIAAFLFRPPYAALLEHEDAVQARRNDLFAALAGVGLNLDVDLVAAERADALAWAADRPPFADAPNPFPRDPRVRHPFNPDAEPRSLWVLDDPLTPDDISRVAATTDDVIVDIVRRGGGDTDPRAAFFALWRLLPIELGRVINEIGENWRLMPADGRLSDSCWSHASTAAAIAGTLDADGQGTPAFLIFTLSGAQDFISQARRTQDFWAGSYLLSGLVGAAMLWAAEQLGPDTVLTPSIREQPLIDDWFQHMLPSQLSQHSAFQYQSDRDLIANLPNIFTLLVSADQISDVGSALECAVKHERNKRFKGVERRLGNAFPTGDTRWKRLWQQQRVEFLRTGLFWSALPWDATPAAALTRLDQEMPENLTGETIRAMWPNAALPAGTAYPIAGQLASWNLSLRKLTRDFPSRPAWNNLGACTLCGQRPAMHAAESTVGALQRSWRTSVAAVDPPGRIRPTERLCAVCLVKRLAFSYDVPSTASIATAPFKLAVVDVFGQADASDLRRTLRAFLDQLKQVVGDVPTVRWSIERASTLPLLTKHLQDLEFTDPKDRALLEQFLQIDGSWLDPDQYQSASIEREFSATIPSDSLARAQRARNRLVRAAEDLGIPAPASYYAILVVDGDHSGRWVGGQRNPTYLAACHPQQAGISDEYEWRSQRRLAGPAGQGALATSLSSFALTRVPLWVEQRYPGKLIYAGGDDVVALVPLRHGLTQDSTGAGDPNNPLTLIDQLHRDFRANFRDDGSFGLGDHADRLDSVPQAASLSASLTIVHSSAPLAFHIQEGADRLKHVAKEELGRNALVVTLTPRSGDLREARIKWGVGGTNPVEQVGTLVQHLASGVGDHGRSRALSPRLAHELLRHELVDGLGPLLREKESLPLALAEIRRLATRHADTTNGAEVAEDIARLGETLHQMYKDLDKQRRELGDVAEPPDPYETLTSLLRIVEFVERGS